MKEDGIEEYEKALKTCERMLTFEMDIAQESNIFRKIGDIYLEIFKKNNDLQSCEHAVQAYQRSLAVYTQENYPHHRARVMKSLGYAYAARSDIFDQGESLKQAINFWEESLAVYSRLSYPGDYAILQDELSVAYRKLAELGDGVNNSKMAIDAAKNALSIYSLKDHPQEFARGKTNLGSAYLTLAQFADEPEDRMDSCKQAIASYQDALQVYDPGVFTFIL